MTQAKIFEAPSARPGDDPRKMAYVRAGDLEIDQNVQRGVDPAKLDRMQEAGDGFSFSLAEVPTVVERQPGRFVVLEGQHRVTLQQQIDPDAAIWVVVLDDERDEAGIALLIARTRKMHTLYDQWQLRLRRGEPMQVQAQAVLDQLGLALSGFSRLEGYTSIAAVAALRYVMDLPGDPDYTQGAALLDSTLSVILAAWQSAPKMWEGVLIKSVARLLQRNPGIDKLRLTRTLSAQLPARWSQEQAHRRQNQSALEAVGTAIRDQYNHALSQGRRIEW